LPDFASSLQGPWDARLARRLVAPLAGSGVTPNHLTTLRLAVGLAAVAAFVPGTYGWSNFAALLLVCSNFLDHTDGELARMTGKASRAGHLYDLASDAAVTILLFVAIGISVGKKPGGNLGVAPAALGAFAGISVALIFYLRMRIEDLTGKSATRQPSLGGFESEDVLYLLPLATLCNALSPLLLAASVCTPMYAIWVAIDYRRVRRADRRAEVAESAGERGAAALNDTRSFSSKAPAGGLAERLASFDLPALRRDYARQGDFLYIADFLPPDTTAQLIAAVDAVNVLVNRNYLPGHKQGGSVSRHAIDELAPAIADLYRSPALMQWLQQLTGERLQVSPAADPHAYALYFYTRAGDHIGWHYDTSYYAGRRYTLLLGVVDESSCRLDYELHTREKGVAIVAGSIKIPPGGLVIFDGDALRHRITPLCEGEIRVSLAFEYVTNPRMHPGWRLISNMKDAFAYFGFRQVFRGVTQSKDA
jgi:phosphatidylglycerophosphate synthase